MKEFKFIDDCDLLQDPCIKVDARVTHLEWNERFRHGGMQFMVDPVFNASIRGMVGKCSVSSHSNTHKCNILCL
jgi:hypothetical protein